MKFVPHTPVVTATPAVSVDPFDKAGTYRFQLVVTDNSGNNSAPALREVVVEAQIIKEPVKDPVDPPIFHPPIPRPI